MAKILKSRTWFLYSNNKTTYAGESSSLNAIDYSKYASVSLGDADTQASWIAAPHGTKTVYISQHIVFSDISYNGAQDLCNKTGKVIIDNKEYVLKIMPISFWLDLTSDVYSNISAANYSFITENVSTAKYHTINRDSKSKVFNNNGTINDKNKKVDEESKPIAFIPVLVPGESSISISGSDVDLGKKTSNFKLSYSVNGSTEDKIRIEEELNGKLINVIDDATKGKVYTLGMTNGLYSDLPSDETITIKITATDGAVSDTRIFSFEKISGKPNINYSGDSGLGTITKIPTITYSVSDNVDEKITITEKLNDRILYSGELSVNTNRTVGINNTQWAECLQTNVLEVTATNSNGESDVIEVTFSKGSSNRIEVLTKPITVDVMPTKISLELDWKTNNATGKVYVTNNAHDKTPVWEDMTGIVNTNNIYLFTNREKASEEWGISIKVVVFKDAGSTSEIDVFGIRGTYE